MLNKKTFLKINQAFIVIIALCISFTSFAAYEHFPGKHKVRVISVDAANALTVNFETWPGYGATVSVTLPDLVLPGNTMKPTACELALAEKALAFTQEFVTSAKNVSINHLLMETSADDYGTANVMTEGGSLSQALEKEGLARSTSVDSETPWCQ